MAGLQSDLAGLGKEAKSAIEEALGSKLENVSLEQLAGKGAPKNSLVQQALAPISGTIEALAAGLGAAQPNLGKFVDAKVSTLTEPLATVNTKLSGWLDGYDKVRKEIGDQMVNRAKEGIKAELSVGVNRSRTKQALIELDFDLANKGAADACLKAMKGNFTPGPAARQHARRRRSEERHARGYAQAQPQLRSQAESVRLQARQDPEELGRADGQREPR